MGELQSLYSNEPYVNVYLMMQLDGNENRFMQDNMDNVEKTWKTVLSNFTLLKI